MTKRRVDEMMYNIVKFLSGLHDCHACNFVLKQIKGMTGIERTICTKYNRPVKQVRNNCVDRFHFSLKDIDEVEKQVRARKCELVINGVAA